MKVAVTHPCYWPEVRRGAERFVHDLSTGLATRGHDVALVTSHRGWASRTVEEGVAVVRTWRPPDDRLRRRKYDEHLTHLPLAALALRRADPDAVVACHHADGVVAARWRRRTGRPVVFAAMGTPQREFLVHRRLRLEATLASVAGASVTVALSQAVARAFARVLGVDARVIPPGIDLAAFAPAGDRAPEPTLFCPAAWEVEMKRVPLLLEALPAVRRARPGTRLVLFRPRDAATAAALAREDGVELVDGRDPATMLPSYRRAWVTALPSLGEAFGLVYAESLACGTPVVGARDAATPEVVDSPAIGRLAAPDDVGDLVRALVEGLDLATDPATAARCRARAEYFSIERCAERYETLLAELVAAA